MVQRAPRATRSSKAVESVLVLALLLFAISPSSNASIPPESLPLAIGNTLEQGRDYFIGPCLVNTNQTCPDKEVTFFLFTKRNPKAWQQIFVDGSGSNLGRTNFNASNPTKIVVHGYDSDMELSYLVDVRNEYLKRYDYNVIAVDWHRLATAPCYPIAVQNVPHVGDCLAQLVERLRDEGAEDVHVIGFSLGARARVRRQRPQPLQDVEDHGPGPGHAVVRHGGQTGQAGRL